MDVNKIAIEKLIALIARRSREGFSGGWELNMHKGSLSCKVKESRVVSIKDN